MINHRYKDAIPSRRVSHDKIRCIHTDYDICYCGCPKCEKDCTIEKQNKKVKE